MLSSLDEAERNPNEGWKTLPQHNEIENDQDHFGVEEETGTEWRHINLIKKQTPPQDENTKISEEATKCSSRTVKSPWDYKFQSFKIPKRTSPRSNSKSVLPDNIKAMGFKSGFTAHNTSSHRGNTKSDSIRYMIERQRSLPRSERTSQRHNTSKVLSQETSKQEQPFDAEISMLMSNHDAENGMLMSNHDNHCDIANDKDDDSGITADHSANASPESSYNNTRKALDKNNTRKALDKNDVESEEDDIEQSRRHTTCSSSKVTALRSIHETNSNKTSFYGIHSDDKKRKLTSDEDNNDNCEEPSTKKPATQKKYTGKKRGRKPAQQSQTDVSLVEIISSDEEGKTEMNHSTTTSTSTSQVATSSKKLDKNDSTDESCLVKTKATIKDNPFERDSFTSEIAIGPRVLLGSLQGIAKGPLEITVNQLKWKMEYKEKAITILICPQDLTSLKVHIDTDPKIILLGVTQCLALKLRSKCPGNGKFLDPGSLVVGEGDIVLEVDDNLGPEMIIDIAEWASETHGKPFTELSLTDAQTIMDRFNLPSLSKSGQYNTRSSSSVKSRVTPRRMIIYPSPPLQGGITVTSADLECLADGQFLNDVIIDFYLKYIYHGILNHEDKERTHIFSSFFYKRLTQRRSKDSEDAESSQHRLHNKVKNWTRNVDIFSKDFIIVPINESSHWYLAIICYPHLDGPVLEEEMLSDDSVVDVEQEREAVMKANPCILIFDSLGGSGRARVTANLRSYLSCEWKLKRQDEPTREFTKETIKGSFPKVPQQDNHCDCGVFLLQYVQTFFQDPICNFKPPINKVDWFTQAKVASKRQEIKDLIVCISQAADETPCNQ